MRRIFSSSYRPVSYHIWGHKRAGNVWGVVLGGGERGQLGGRIVERRDVHCMAHTISPGEFCPYNDTRRIVSHESLHASRSPTMSSERLLTASLTLDDIRIRQKDIRRTYCRFWIKINERTMAAFQEVVTIVLSATTTTGVLLVGRENLHSITARLK